MCKNQTIQQQPENHKGLKCTEGQQGKLKHTGNTAGRETGRKQYTKHRTLDFQSKTGRTRGTETELNIHDRHDRHREAQTATD